MYLVICFELCLKQPLFSEPCLNVHFVKIIGFQSVLMYFILFSVLVKNTLTNDYIVLPSSVCCLLSETDKQKKTVSFVQQK
jgi:hypothetical protein